MRNFIKTYWKLLIVLLLILSTLTGAVCCYVKHATQNSPKGVTVECVGKKNGQSSSYGGFPTTEIYFEIRNNGKETLHDLDATVNISSKNGVVTLLHKELDSVFSPLTFISPGESEIIYIYLYDIKHDNGGIENFDQIYKSDISDLNVDFKVNSVEWAFAPAWELWLALFVAMSVILFVFLVAFVRCYSLADIIDDLRFGIIIPQTTNSEKSTQATHKETDASLSESTTPINVKSQESITKSDVIDTVQDDNEDFDIQEGKLVKYTGRAENIRIPDGVKTIGAHAFSNNNGIKTVFIPSTVKTIGRGAFEECENLKKVTMSDGVSKIGKYAFRFCSKLSSVTLPNGIRNIENGAFEGCSELCGITLPDGLINIGESAFHCCGLCEIDIPRSVKSIEALTFCDCELSDITLHEGLEIIHEHAFGGCKAIVTIPNTVKHVNWLAFEDLLDNSHVETIYYAGSEERATEIGLLSLAGDVDVYYDGKSDED